MHTTWRDEPALPARPAEAWGFTSYSAMLHGLASDGAASAAETAQAATFLEEVASGESGGTALWPAEQRGDEDPQDEPAEGTARLADEVVQASAPEEVTEDASRHFSEGGLQEIRAQPAAPDAPTGAAGGLLHDFPRGAGPGSFLHSLLEWAGQEGFERTAAHSTELRAQVQRRCEQAGYGPWAARLQDWLAQWLVTPLPLGTDGSRASSVAPQGLRSVKVEMEFWFPAPQVPLRQLDELVRRHCLPGLQRPALSAHTLNGMLKGFIDLVFEREGRYFVADHKSNWLGPTDADYTPQRMRQVMLDKRYDLQAVLYVFALHRLLRSRLAGYDYEQHVGGAAYLFLRGHAAPGQGPHLERPPLALIEALDEMFSPSSAAGTSGSAT
ncbi:MAG: PD-(D/E)XK nuclease family protein [Rubrivivax sp.]